MQNQPQATPGLYPGPGLASLLRPNEQQYLLQAQTIAAGQSTIALQLGRLQDGYPWGAAFQLKCASTPGTFEIDILGSETDESIGSYVQLGTITTVNSSNFGRYDMPPTVFPKFVTAYFKTWPNAGVVISLLATR